MGLIAGGLARQDSSKWRIVALSITPAFWKAEAVSWIDSKASLLYLRPVVIAYLHYLATRQKTGNIRIGHLCQVFGERTKRLKFILIDICAVLFRKQILVRLDRIPRPPSQINGSEIDALLESLAQMPVRDARTADEITGYGPDGLPSLYGAEES